jgi:hypothetical protein
VTTDPQQPGFHYYSLTIDGVTVADPAVETYFGSNWISSSIEIPGADADFCSIKDVPHGEIQSKR